MSASARLAAAAYLLKRLVLKGEVQRFAPDGLAAPRPGVPPEEGVVDGVAGGAVRGWAKRLDDPQALVRVDIYLDDVFVGRASCNLPRPDLANLAGFHPSGRHGFQFALPEEAVRLGGRMRVVAADCGLELSGSPIQLQASVAAEAAADVGQLLSKVWYTKPSYPGVTSLAQMRRAYGGRLSILTEIEPQTPQTPWPVTRAMSYVNARLYGGRAPVHGLPAYFALLKAAGAHFAGTRAGLPMSPEQVEVLTRPTGWLVDGEVRSSLILDAFAKAPGIGEALGRGAVAELLTRFVVEVLAQHRLPMDLLGADALAFLQGAEGGRTRFEAAFATSTLFAASPSNGQPAAAAAVRLAVQDLGLQALVSGGESPPPPKPAAPDTIRPGVRIITGDHGESGLSLNARNSVAALQLAGIETRVGAAPLSTQADFTAYEALGRPPFATVLLHLPPNDAVEVILRLPPEQAAARLVGFFMWETENLPQTHRLGALLVDEIWTASPYCKDIFSAAAPGAPVHVVGHAVQLAEPEPGFDARAWAGVRPGDFVFLFHFDAHSWITRKNPTAVVRAFRQAFGAEVDDVRLVLKLRRSADAALDQWRQWWEEFFEEAAADPRIVILHEDLSPERMSALTHAADAFVSLHRSEGFGYGLAEAMLAGKPMIASAYSGSLAFTRADETLLIPVTPRPIGEDEFLYSGPAQVWGEPDVGEAAAAMRTLHADSALADRLGRLGRERIARECSLKALAARYVEALGPLVPQSAPPASRS